MNGPIAVLAGTPVDTRMGVAYLEERGLPGVPFPLSRGPREQTAFQHAPAADKRRQALAVLRGAMAQGCRRAFVYCNSLSAAVDFPGLAEETGMRIVTPLDVYRRLAPRYRALGVIAANAQGLSGIEKVLLEANPALDLLGACALPVVLAVEAGMPPEELVERHHDLQKLCKELDPTRSTTIAHVSHTPTDGPMHHITDLESYNHYFGWYGGKIEDNGPWLDKFHAEHPDICLGVSEYGCEGIINWHSSTPQCKDYTEEYQAVYHEYMAQAFEDRPWIWASHVWNMFDFGCAARNEGGVAGRNNKGLVTIDRKTRKDSFYLYQAYWTKDPMVHINGRRYAQRAGETTEVKVYSNQDCVTLYLNGKEVGTQQAHRVFHFTVALAEGFNTLLAVAGSAKDSITLEKVEKEPACYTLPEFNERQEGVANWFKQMGSLDLESPMEFPEGYYNIKDSMAELAKNEEAFAIVAKAVKLVTNFDLKPGQGMWSMMSGMSPEHMSGMISTDLLGDKFLPSLNAQLIKIKK